MSALSNTFQEINSAISGVDEFFEFDPDWINMRDTFFLDLTGQNIGIANIEPTETLDISGNMKVDGYINQVVSGIGDPYSLYFPNDRDGGFYYNSDDSGIYLCYNHTGDILFNRFSNESFDKLTNTFQEIDTVITGVHSLTPSFPEIDAILVGINSWVNPLATVDAQISELTGLYSTYEEIDYAASGIQTLSVTFDNIDDGINFILNLNYTSTQVNQYLDVISGADSYLTFDSVNNYLGINKTFPTEALDVIGNVYTAGTIESTGDITSQANVNVSGYFNQKIEDAGTPDTSHFPNEADQGIYKNTSTNDLFRCYNDGSDVIYEILNAKPSSTDLITIKEEFLGSLSNLTGNGQVGWNFADMSGTGSVEGILDSGRMGVLQLKAGNSNGESSAIYYGETGQEGSFDFDFLDNSRLVEIEWLYKIDPDHEYWIGVSENPTGTAPNDSSFFGIHHSSGDSKFQFLSTGALGGSTGASSIDVDSGYHKLNIKMNSLTSNFIVSVDNETGIALNSNVNNLDGLSFSVQAKSLDASQATVNLDAFSFYAVR
jgi:hypothetical protein